MTDKITIEREALEALELMLGDFCVSGRATDATRALSRKVAAALAAQPADAQFEADLIESVGQMKRGESARVWQPAEPVEPVACTYPHCSGAAPEDQSCCRMPFTLAMADAAERYWRSVGRFAHPLPAQFRWVDCFNAMIAAAPPAPAAVPPGMMLVPDYRGYANLGTGQYLLNISGADEPPELVISIASDEEKAGRTVGDLRDNKPGTVIQPEQMAVRLRFASEAGLAALEQQLRILREERFAAAGDKP